MGITTIPSSGVWLVSYTARVYPTTGGTTINRYYSSLTFTINGTVTANIAVFESSATQNLVYGNNYVAGSGSYIVNVPTITSTTNVSLGISIAITSGTNTLSCDSGTMIQLVRIA